MTLTLQALAVGAVIAGFVGIPAALGGGNAIEHFLEPSFTASAVHSESADAAPAAAAEHAPAEGEHGAAEAHPSTAVELGLMLFSVVVALVGIGLAWTFYVTKPEISEGLATRWAGAHRLLLNKYYVDEAYDAALISKTMAGGRGLWSVDRNVVDGAVNGSGWVTLFSAWVSGLTDRHIVDGAVNMVGSTTEESSYWFRRVQTGLVQNYALLMLFGVFALVTVYLWVR